MTGILKHCYINSYSLIPDYPRLPELVVERDLKISTKAFGLS